MNTAEERIELAKKALVATGYFTEDQVGDDIAPRIIELHAALTQQQHKLEGAACSCGNWKAPLGTVVWREFDKHLLDVRRVDHE